MIEFKLLHPLATYEMLGFVPDFFDERNPASAKEQVNQNYKQGGGWNTFKGHTYDPIRKALKYPGDPSLPALAEAQLHKEKLIFFDSAWLMIMQEDGTYEIARVD